jgi:molecular chaperone HscB
MIGTCPRCDAPISLPTCCDSCKSIFEPNGPSDAFALLALTRSFAVDRRELDRKHVEAGRRIHPDYFGSADERSRRLSESLSARINEAHATLRDPDRRADYLVGLYGGPSAADRRTMPRAFLESVLDARMELEEARESNDRATLDRLAARFTEEASAARSRIAELFGSVALDRGEVPSAEALASIRSELNAVKYLQGLIDETEK